MYLLKSLGFKRITGSYLRRWVIGGSGLMAVLALSSCQTNIERQRIQLNSSQFPASSLRYTERPSSSMERQVQTISGTYQGKQFQAAYVRAPTGYVWVRRAEELPVKALMDWGRWKNTDVKLGSYNTVKTSLAEIQFRRFRNRQTECVFFGRSFGWSSGDDTRRATQKLSGYFCEKPNESLNETDIADLLHGFTLVRTAQPLTSAPSVSKTDPVPSAGSDNGPSMSRTLVGVWEGESDSISGSFLTDSLVNKGRLKVVLDRENRANAVCTGQWLWAKGKYNSVPLPQGTWSIACDDGLTAGGTYVSSAPNIGTIEGVDAKG